MAQDGRTDHKLGYWVSKYVLFWGTRSMSSLGQMSPAMATAAHSQDIIGWRLFMEGRVSVEIAAIQKLHCAAAPCVMNGSDWMKQFITRILHISHSQWIFRNFTLHDKLRGTIKLREWADVLAEVVTLAEMDPSTLPPESRFLLEMDFSTLKRSPLERQSYWVRAMKAARRAGQRTALAQSRRGASARGTRRRHGACSCPRRRS